MLLLPAASAQRRVSRLKTPRDKCSEPARLFLQLAHDFKMVDALIECLAHAEHHRRRGAHAKLVRGAVHADPILRPALEPRDPESHIVIENLRASAGNRIETRIAQTGNRIAQTQPEYSAIANTSEADKQCNQICGNRCLIPVNNRSNQSIFKSGWRPPCISTPVPPISTVSAIFS